mmetsp:Transcript_18662/g.25720  ORF Transcript_18662/g.25720 Transcript_18662/m.25720 type:complete len:93 (-) Transcript_18662:905-1183(-)
MVQSGRKAPSNYSIGVSFSCVSSSLVQYMWHAFFSISVLGYFARSLCTTYNDVESKLLFWPDTQTGDALPVTELLESSSFCLPSARMSHSTE